MMKKHVVFVLLIISVYSASAQTADTTFRSPEKELASFYRVVNAAGMDGVFNSSPVTIFAPDNKAFEKLPLADSLLRSQNMSALTGLLNDHIIPGKLTVKDITGLIRQNNGSANLTSLSGRKYIFKINANRNLVLIDELGVEHVVEVFNIMHGDAVIFLIDTVIAAKE